MSERKPFLTAQPVAYYTNDNVVSFENSTRINSFHEMYFVSSLSRPKFNSHDVASIPSSSTPHNIPIILGDCMNDKFKERSYRIDNFRSTVMKVVERQRTDLNQYKHGTIIKTTYQHSSFNIHVLEHHWNEKFYFHLCIASPSVPLRVCFALLDRIKSDFMLLIQDDNTKGSAVTNVLARQLAYCSNVTNDKLLMIQSQLEDVKNIMIKNIDKIFDNMERTQVLVQRTNDLMSDTHTFQYQTKKVKNYMLCKVIAISSVILLILIIVIIAIVLLVKYA